MRREIRLNLTSIKDSISNVNNRKPDRPMWIIAEHWWWGRWGWWDFLECKVNMETTSAVGAGGIPPPSLLLKHFIYLSKKKWKKKSCKNSCFIPFIFLNSSCFFIWIKALLLANFIYINKILKKIMLCLQTWMSSLNLTHPWCKVPCKAHDWT